jgi:hypothetical protein
MCVLARQQRNSSALRHFHTLKISVRNMGVQGTLEPQDEHRYGRSHRVYDRSVRLFSPVYGVNSRDSMTMQRLLTVRECGPYGTSNRADIQTVRGLQACRVFSRASYLTIRALTPDPRLTHAFDTRLNSHPWTSFDAAAMFVPVR